MPALSGYQDRCPGQTRRNVSVRIVAGVAGFLGARGEQSKWPRLTGVTNLKTNSLFIDFFLHSCTVHLGTIESFIYPTDTQLE